MNRRDALKALAVLPAVSAGVVSAAPSGEPVGYSPWWRYDFTTPCDELDQVQPSHMTYTISDIQTGEVFDRFTLPWPTLPPIYTPVRDL